VRLAYSTKNLRFPKTWPETRSAPPLMHGNYDSDFEKYLVAAVSLAALVFALPS
jgi:hypothetical protein